MSWWYFSFADSSLPADTQWLGGVYIEGDDFFHAHLRTHELGINPGGECKGWCLVDFPPPKSEFTNKLLKTKEEVDGAWAIADTLEIGKTNKPTGA